MKQIKFAMFIWLIYSYIAEGLLESVDNGAHFKKVCCKLIELYNIKKLYSDTFFNFKTMCK